MVYYNEIDPVKAEVLRESIKAGVIALGDVDERSIVDVRGTDLRGYVQCHFFAGGGFWGLALRNAGWGDDSPVWTGSCPCPSFSTAGKGRGFEDPRHLWPFWSKLIAECKPAVIFGEQVASSIRYGWLDLVQSDLEAQDYAVGKIVFGACSVGAPHIRKRLYFVADSLRDRAERTAGSEVGETFNTQKKGRREEGERGKIRARRSGSVTLFGSGGSSGELGNSMQERRQQFEDGDRCDGERMESTEREQVVLSETGGNAGDLAESECDGSYEAAWDEAEQGGNGSNDGLSQRGSSELRISGQVGGYWDESEWIHCRDGKYRPVEPGTFPLAYVLPRNMGAIPSGVRGLAEVAGLDKQSLARAKSHRVNSLRLYGDGIVVSQATEFIKAYQEARG